MDDDGTKDFWDGAWWEVRMRNGTLGFMHASRIRVLEGKGLAAIIGVALRQLLHRQDVAALATLHKGEPAVSMVPYALLPGGALVIHVSQLATHTRGFAQAFSLMAADYANIMA